MHNKPRLGYMFAKMAMEIPYPQDDILFISDEVYKFQILDELGASAWAAGKPHVGYHACKRLIEENLIPEPERERVANNLIQYEQLLGKMHTENAKEDMMKEMQQKTEEKIKKKAQKEEKRNRVKLGTKTPSPKSGKKRKR